MNHNIYGYGIIDRHGKPWWSEDCVCEDRGPLREITSMLNDRGEMNRDKARAPFRVVRLVWKGRGK